MAYLQHEGAYKEPSSAPRPDMILLDLNLPRMSGHEVLHFLKQDLRFKHVPIIVLTTSGRPDDVRLAYEAGANAYLLKPVEFARFTDIMGHLGKFWLETVELPLRCTRLAGGGYAPAWGAISDIQRRGQAMAGPSYQLLVIDDSKRDSLLLERILQKAEDATFTITHVESANAGLEELSAHHYDLVLLDYYLPDMDGIAFLEEKQRRGLTPPVIMLTAFGQERLPVAALQAGALDYFRKDQVNSGLLGKAIQQAIEKARLRASACSKCRPPAPRTRGHGCPSPTAAQGTASLGRSAIVGWRLTHLWPGRRVLSSMKHVPGCFWCMPALWCQKGHCSFPYMSCVPSIASYEACQGDVTPHRRISSVCP